MAKIFFARFHDIGAGGVFSEALEFNARHGERELQRKNDYKTTLRAALCPSPPLGVEFGHLRHHKGAAPNEDHIGGPSSGAGGGHGSGHRAVDLAR
jgi:hypothetical protein